jgi:hypothetical protein
VLTIALLLASLLLSRLLVTWLLLSRLLAAALDGLLVALELIGLHAVLLLPWMHVARLLLAARGDLAACGIDREVVHVSVVARAFDAVAFVFTHILLLVRVSMA